MGTDKKPLQQGEIPLTPASTEEGTVEGSSEGTYQGKYPTAYHPHGDYSLQVPRARDSGAGRHAPAVNALDVPGTVSPNKPEVLLHQEKINKGHGSSNVLVDGTDD